MPDEPTKEPEKPSEGKEAEQKSELKGRLLTDDETSDWGNEAVLVEKDPKTESNVLRKEIEEAASEEKNEEAEQVEKPAEKTVDEPLQEIETVEIEDPGEFAPQDYSFDVVTYDEEGKKPKTVKIKSIEQWDELLEGEVNLGSSAAVSKAFRAAQKMESGIEKDYAQWESQSAEYKTAVESEQIRAQRSQTIFNEMQYLIDKGDLPSLTAEERDTLNWEDADVLKAHPNIAQHKELLNYMRKENSSRSKVGLAALSSVLDAFNAMQLDTRRQTDNENKTKVAEARKAAGARVASGSPGPVSSVSPKGIAVGRVGDLSRLGQNWQV